MFFGRAAETQRALELLAGSRFVSIVGASGSGKSSLMRAGLLAALEAGEAIAGSERWRQHVMRPGGTPLAALAAGLAGQAGMLTAVHDLTRSEQALHLLTEAALAGGEATDRVVVAVDQLEEAFTLCGDPDERRALFANLVYAAAVPAGRTVVVVSLRADFYPRLAAHPTLVNALGAHRPLIVGPLDAAGLRQVIEQPAFHGRSALGEWAGGDRPRQRGRRARRPTAAAAGGAARHVGATRGRHAHGRGLPSRWRRARRDRRAGRSGLSHLRPRQRELVRHVLLRLTQPGENTGDTRRRASASALTPDAGAREDVATVVRRFVDARLLTTGHDEGGRAWVEVAHEALIRGWPRLRAWIDDDRDGLRLHRRLTDAAEQWEREGRSRSLLLRGPPLAAARAWSRSDPAPLNPLERSFLSASRRRRLAGRAAGGVALGLTFGALLWLALPEIRGYDYKRRARGADTMAVFPAGRVTLGRDQRVDLAAFELDRHEVTNAQYVLCVKVRRCTPPDEPGATTRTYASADPLPVVYVTALQAAIFCEWLDKRLPSDAEWERAARGLDQRRYPWGNDTNAGRANIGGRATVPVDAPGFSSGETPERVSHLLGNVAEWTGTPSGCRPSDSACRRIWNGRGRVTALNLRGGS